MPRNWRLPLILIMGLIGLAGVYVFQRANYALFLLQAIGVPDPRENLVFGVSKTLRLVANDLICFGVLFGIFREKSDRQVILAIFLVELFILLPLYLVLKLNLEGPSEISSPLLSFIHRLIVNPTLMVLTGIALAYQRFVHPFLP